MELRNYLYIALLTAISLVLFLVEGLIPLPFIAPGAKLGLANIVTVCALFSLGPRACLFIILLRTGLASFFGGGPVIFLYSIIGGLLSLAAMTALKKTAQMRKNGLSDFFSSWSGIITRKSLYASGTKFSGYDSHVI